jgi:hypothetical protein
MDISVLPGSGPKIGFWVEVDFKTISRKGRRNSGTYVSCSELYGGFNGAKTEFVSPSIREVFRARPRSTLVGETRGLKKTRFSQSGFLDL